MAKTKFNLFIWKQWRLVWKLRNESLHGKDTAAQVVAEASKVKRRLIKIPDGTECTIVVVYRHSPTSSETNMDNHKLVTHPCPPFWSKLTASKSQSNTGCPKYSDIFWSFITYSESLIHLTFEWRWSILDVIHLEDNIESYGSTAPHHEQSGNM
jgi:hypothetical protein